LDRLNTILARQGLVMYTAKVRGPKRYVAYIAEDDRGEVFGLFELRPIEKEGSPCLIKLRGGFSWMCVCYAR
jgi:hypothetical protein